MCVCYTIAFLNIYGTVNLQTFLFFDNYLYKRIGWRGRYNHETWLFDVYSQDQQQQQVSTVTAKLMNSVLGNVLKLIRNNIGTPNAPWMNRIASEWRWW